MLCIFAHLLLPDKKPIVAVANTIAVYGNFLDLLSTIPGKEFWERKNLIPENIFAYIYANKLN